MNNEQITSDTSLGGSLTNSPLQNNKLALTPLYKSPRTLRPDRSLEPLQQMIESGSTILVINEWHHEGFNNLVTYLSDASGQSVDWARSGVGGQILALGDIDKVRTALVEKLPDLNKQLQKFLAEQYGPSYVFTPYQQSDIDACRDQDILARPFMPRKTSKR